MLGQVPQRERAQPSAFLSNLEPIPWYSIRIRGWAPNQGSVLAWLRKPRLCRHCSCCHTWQKSQDGISRGRCRRCRAWAYYGANYRYGHDFTCNVNHASQAWHCSWGFYSIWLDKELACSASKITLPASHAARRETTLNGRRYMVPDAELVSTLFAPLRSPVSLLDLYPQWPDDGCTVDRWQCPPWGSENPVPSWRPLWGPEHRQSGVQRDPFFLHLRCKGAQSPGEGKRHNPAWPRILVIKMRVAF